MTTITITQAFVSKGFDGKDGIVYSESGKAVFFRVGVSKYDKEAPDNKRWVNLRVKALGEGMVKRISAMKLKESSMVNLRGQLDEETWTDKSGEKRFSYFVVLEEIEYAGMGNGAGSSERTAGTAAPKGSASASPNPGFEPPDDMPSGFTGFTSLENDGDLPFL